MSEKVCGLPALFNMSMPPRPAWIEIDLNQLRHNFKAIFDACPAGTDVCAVVKDQAYGHGAVEISHVALQSGAKCLAVSTPDEGIRLRDAQITCPILLLGERHPDELPDCVEHKLICCISDTTIPAKLSALNKNPAKPIPIHVKVDTGMSRYGIRWDQAIEFVTALAAIPSVTIQGIMTHFAMSDEEDKTFALLQMQRFNSVIGQIEKAGIHIPIQHLCNSGGFLDLPAAHLQMVRLGILPLGVYPSKVCRRIPGIHPIMSVKSRLSKIREIQAGESVGYGMRYIASGRRRIAVLPLGYGDGFPRVRNEGYVLLHGQKAPIIGGVSMDAITVDITHIEEAKQWDEVVLMGDQSGEQIAAQHLAELKRSVSYDLLTGWRARLPRIYLR
jgi:alanine racemase